MQGINNINNPLPNTLVKPMESKSKFTPLIVGLAVLILILFGLTGVLAYQNMQLQKMITQKQVMTSPVLSNDPTANWKTYTIKAIGLQYKLPSSLSKFGDVGEQIIPGEKGTQLCITFLNPTGWLIKPVFAGSAQCVIVHFGFGTTSVDFGAGREGGFTDLKGFKKQNGKYYARFTADKNPEIPSDIVEEIKNKNDISIIKIKGKQYDGPSIFVNDGSVGALLNTNDSTYPGIAVEMELKNGLTVSDFDQILSTFKFTDQNQTSDTSSWKTYTNGKFSFRYPADWKYDGGASITSLSNIKIVANNEGNMMNECMSQTGTEQRTNFVLRKYNRDTFGQMCSGGNELERDVWVVKSKDSYGPGIQIRYVSNSSNETQVESILSTFKFTQ